MLDVRGPALQLLDVLVVVGLLQRRDIQLLEAFPRRLVTRAAQLQHGLGEDLAHRAGWARVVRIREVHADAGRGTADGHAMVDQLGQLVQAAATDDLRTVGRRLAVLDELPDGRQVLEPFHQAVVIAAVRRQVAERHDQPNRHAGAIRVDQAGHVEADGPPLERAVAQHYLVASRLLRLHAEAFLDQLRAELDDLLHALKERRLPAFLGADARTLEPLLADQM